MAISGAKWRAASLVLAILSIAANLEWVNLPFSFYGLHGRSGVLYGEYTLLQTFYFHPAGGLWWVLIGLQVFAVLVIVTNVTGLGTEFKMTLLTVPAIGLLMLDLYIGHRWGTLALWSMYVMGAIPGLLLIGSGICYAKSH